MKVSMSIPPEAFGKPVVCGRCGTPLQEVSPGYAQLACGCAGAPASAVTSGFIYFSEQAVSVYGDGHGGVLLTVRGASQMLSVQMTAAEARDAAQALIAAAADQEKGKR